MNFSHNSIQVNFLSNSTNNTKITILPQKLKISPPPPPPPSPWRMQPWRRHAVTPWNSSSECIRRQGGRSDVIQGKKRGKKVRSFRSVNHRVNQCRSLRANQMRALACHICIALSLPGPIHYRVGSDRSSSRTKKRMFGQVRQQIPHR